MRMLKQSLLAAIAVAAVAPTAAISGSSVEAPVCIGEAAQSAAASIYCPHIRDQYLCTIKGCQWDDESGSCSN